MLQKDPGLVAELAEQFGIETTDPQEIVNAVIGQMQQQVQQVSGDLSPISDVQTTTPPPPPEPPTPSSELPTPLPHLPTPNSSLPTPSSELPPPPPAPKLEYKPEDPWSNNLLANNEEVLPETVNTPDRGV